jgi:plasmid stability protein
MTPTPAANDPAAPRSGGGPPPDVQQQASASGHAKQVIQGEGVQNVYLAEPGKPPEDAVSIAPPTGQLDGALPLRGRGQLLADLSAASPRVHVVHGMGGCGKTRLALEAAAAAQQRGTDVWWISAAQPGRLEAGMRALGRRLGLTDTDLDHGDAADLIWQHLHNRPHPWLLVIDNADDPQLLAGAGTCVAEGRGWLRPLPAGPGTVLVTSRDGTAATWGPWCGRHRVGMLPPGEAAAMLADHAGQHAGLGSQDDARELAHRLGGLPLALKIAGSYLAQSAAIPPAFADPSVIRTYQQYRETIETRGLTAAFPPPSGDITPEQARELIGATWDLTLDLLDARQLPETRPILGLLATLADAPIPYQLLLNPATMAASPLFHGLTGSRLWQALQALDNAGLLDLNTSLEPGEIPVARLHPLIRDTSHPAATDVNHLAYLELAARLLEQATAAEETGRPEDPPMWPAWQQLTPHAAHVFANLTSQPASPDDALKAAAYAAHMTARYQANQGLHTQALPLYRDVLTARLRILGPDHPSTLATRHCIALEMAELGDHAGAEAEYRDVLTAELRVLGPDHLSTLITRHQIALEMAELGDHAGAEAEFRDVLTAKLRVLGPDHLSTLITRHEIAREMAALGDHAGAEAEFRDVLTARLRVLGPDHPETLAARHQIAREMAELGDHAGAEAEYRDVLTAKLRVLGPDHPDTLATRHCIALEMAALGDHAGAEAEYRDVLTAKLRVLGPDHPSTLRTSEWVDYLERRKKG